MNKNQAVAYVFAQAASMLATMEGMKVLNAERERLGYAFGYSEKDFVKTPEEFGLTHNQVIELFDRCFE